MTLQLRARAADLRDADQTLLALREAGMSYEGIATATRVLLGWRMTPDQVRYALRRRLGVPGDEARSFGGMASRRWRGAA